MDHTGKWKHQIRTGTVWNDQELPGGIILILSDADSELSTVIHKKICVLECSVSRMFRDYIGFR